MSAASAHLLPVAVPTQAMARLLYDMDIAT